MAEKLNIGKRIDCLDKGFVRLVDYLGDDGAIVQAARVSYGKGTTTKRRDRELIRYLMRHRHTSPFEMVEFKFHVKLPIFVARQWIRHRTANVNEYSGRYSEMKDEFYLPNIEQFRKQSEINRQGRGEEKLDEKVAEEIRQAMDETQRRLFDEYHSFLDKDLARELARINLPLSVYTEWYWKIDLHNLFHFLKLRTDWRAQYEIRVYAEAILELIEPVVPLACEAYRDYVADSLSFSRNELLALKEMFGGKTLTEDELKKFGIEGLEKIEFDMKINRINNQT